MGMIDDFLGNERTRGKLAINGAVQGGLQYPNDEDWFAVTLEAGITYYLAGSNAVGTTGFGIAIFDPRLDGIVAVTGGGYEKDLALEFTPGQTGTYYAMAVDLFGNYAQAKYTLSIAPRSTPDDLPSTALTRGALTVEAPAQGVFEQRGDVDWIRFHAKQGYHYTFSAQGQTHASYGTGFVSSLSIVDADGYIVRTSGAGFNPLVTGDYYIAVTGEREGGYSVTATSVRDDFARDFSTTGRLVIGSPVQGSVDYEMDQDLLRVDFEAGKFYTFKLQSAHDFVWGLTLYDGDKKQLTYISGFMRDGSLELMYLAAKAGPCFIEVDRGLTNRRIDYASPYEISLTSASDDIGQDATVAKALTFSAPAQGSLQMGSDRDAFKVSLDAGVTVKFDLDAASGEYLKLEVASGDSATVLASKIVGTTGSLEFTPSTAGEYLVTVTSGGWVAPNLAYALNVGRATDDWSANSAGAAPLAIGSTVAGSLENAADRDWFAVRMEAGATYWIAAHADRFGVGHGAILRILDEAGQQLKTYVLNHEASPLSFMPLTGGTYYVEMLSSFQTTGSYSISASHGQRDDVGDTMPTATRLAVGAAVNGQLEVGSDRDLFRLDVVAGKTYEVKLSATAYSFGAKLTDANGDALTGISPATEQSSRQIVFVAQHTGTVYATVQGSVAGEYQIQAKVHSDDYADRISAAAPSIVEGGSIGGTLEHGADRDVFRVQLDSDRTQIFKVSSSSSGALPPGAEMLRSGIGFANVEQSVINGERILTVTTQTAGEYFLELRGANQASTPYIITAVPFAGDGQGPTLVAQSHLNNAVGLSLTERTITLKFSESIVIDHSAIVLRNSEGETVTLDFGGVYYPMVKGDTLIVKLHNNFSPGSYTLSIPAAAIHDAAGNRYNGPETIAFTTILPTDTADAGNGLYVSKPGTVIDGGPGTDTFVAKGYSAFVVILPDGDDFIVWNTGMGTYDTIRNVERVLLLDQVIALDVDGIAGQAYRLYQAAFNRTPDHSGLGFWIGQMDQGVSLKSVAQAFVGSAEFQSQYGSALTDSAYLQAIYQNVLHRAPDSAGLDFWLNAMHSGYSREDMLVYFSESEENQEALASIIGNGFSYGYTWMT